MVETLSVLCLYEETEDALSLNAAVLLGKLCVHDENAIKKLRQVIKDSKSTHTVYQVVLFLKILVRTLFPLPDSDSDSDSDTDSM